MREGIHPDYVSSAINCACGNSFVTRSTKGDFQVDVCGACHPFYTGTQKLMDTAGRVDRFKRRYEAKKAVVPAPIKAATPPSPPKAKAPKAKKAPAAEAAPAAESTEAADATAATPAS